VTQDAEGPRAKRDKRERRAGQVVGYLRVSSLDQKELRQLEGVILDKRFVDKASGKDLHRPRLEQLTGYVREGDTVICHSMDRLARNLDDHRFLAVHRISVLDVFGPRGI